MNHCGKRNYEHWSPQEYLLFKQELLKQEGMGKINWGTIMELFPNRTKQQLISYRNMHRDDIYSNSGKVSQTIDRQIQMPLLNQPNSSTASSVAEDDLISRLLPILNALMF